jgi:hypothetical protein
MSKLYLSIIYKDNSIQNICDKNKRLQTKKKKLENILKTMLLDKELQDHKGKEDFTIKK